MDWGNGKKNVKNLLVKILSWDFKQNKFQIIIKKIVIDVKKINKLST